MNDHCGLAGPGRLPGGEGGLTRSFEEGGLQTVEKGGHAGKETPRPQ